MNLFDDNLDLAEKMAHKFMNIGKKRYEFEDLHQEALISLHFATENFDISRGVQFQNYAAQKMHLDIVSWMRKQNDLYTPQNIIEVATKINKHKLSELSVEEIASKLNYPTSVVVYALNHLKRDSLIRLDAPVTVSDSFGKISLIDTLIDTHDNLDPALLDFNIFINGLDEKKKAVLLYTQKGLNLYEIAAKLGISHTMVRNHRLALYEKFKEHMKMDLSYKEKGAIQWQKFTRKQWQDKLSTVR